MAEIEKHEELQCRTPTYTIFLRVSLSGCVESVVIHLFSQMIEVLRSQLERSGQRGGQNKLSALRPTTDSSGVLA